jgi:glycosyltransferase involved in cell wall biosynthesis
MVNKIDVCITTRNKNIDWNKLYKEGLFPKGLEYIPVNKVIIETSEPIGIARMKAIQMVTTPIFAFIDDDIIISENWFNGLMPFMDNKKVGAVWGTITNKGLGIFDKAYGAIIPYGELRKHDRFNTNNSLIKTELVKDWKPTIGLNCYEDLDLGFYMMNKGYKILNIPCDTIHLKGFKEVAKSAYWAGSTYLEAYQPNILKHIKQYLRRIIAPFTQIFTHGLLSSVIVAYRNVFFLFGLIVNEFERFVKNVFN